MSQPTPPAGKLPYAQNRGSSPSPWRLGSSSSVKLRLSRSCKVVQGFFFVVGFLVWLSFAWTSSQNEQLKKQLENSIQRLEELNEQVTSSLHRMSDLSRIIMRADEVDRRQRKARRLRRFSGDDERNNISSSSSASKVMTSSFVQRIIATRQKLIHLAGQAHTTQTRVQRLIKRQDHRNGHVVDNRHIRSKQSRPYRLGQEYADRRKYLGRYRPDPRLENLTYYYPSGVRNFSMGQEQLLPLALAARAAKGADEAYSHSFSVPSLDGVSFNTTTTFGSVFVYNHTLQNRSECDVHYISLKYSSSCGDDGLKPAEIKQVLIVAVQRSGTHFAWEMLNRLGVHVHHEGVGPDGAVGWIYSVNALIARRVGRGASNVQTVGNFAGRGYVVNNPVRLSRQRFVRVLHQVRHPLRVISTIIARCGPWDRYWAWIATVRGCENITQQASPMYRAMTLYIVWNRHIERYADLRFRSEVTSPRDICLWAGYDAISCSSPGGPKGVVEPKIFAPANWTLGQPPAGSHRRLLGKGAEEQEEVQEEEEEEGEGEEVEVSIAEEEHEVKAEPPLDPSLHVSWTDLEKESVELANEVRIICLEYGYPLDPNQLPQTRETHQFGA